MPKVITNKEELIAKAIDVFLKKGYYHTTLSDLAKACNIEKAHFYYYFKDKKDMMNECLLSYAKQIKENVLDIATDEKKEPLKRIQKMLQGWKHYTENDYGCLFGNTLLETVGKEPGFERTIYDFFENWKKSLAHVYECAQIKGDFEKMAIDDIEKMQGSLMLMRIYKDKSLQQRTIDQILEKF